jgi:integrase/recombinase XerD
LAHDLNGPEAYATRQAEFTASPAMVMRAATKAGINNAVSPHWLRHAHGSHAIDRGASLP